MKEEFLHQLQQCLPQRGVIEQTRGVPEPPVEVHNLIVSVDVLVDAHVPQPGAHHRPEDPEGGGG